MVLAGTRAMLTMQQRLTFLTFMGRMLDLLIVDIVALCGRYDVICILQVATGVRVLDFL